MGSAAVMSATTVPSLLVPSRRAYTRVGAYDIVKRVVDVVLSLAVLVLLLPVLVILAIAIKVDSPGPILFTQERVGGKRARREDGSRLWAPCTFRIYKFRSMVQDADPTVHEEYVRQFVAGEAPAGDSRPDAPFKLAHDVRVTRVGRVLRRTSLDEVAQLVNVLRGDMSVVGPRPVPLYEAACYGARDAERFAALGGITGLWQVKGRGNVNFDEMVRLDLSYVHRRSILFDFKILVLTIPALLRGRGAA